MSLDCFSFSSAVLRIEMCFFMKDGPSVLKKDNALWERDKEYLWVQEIIQELNFC